MSHFRGMSWKVPSGSVRRTVMGRMPTSSSLRAMSMGLVRLLSTSIKMGAPMDICRDLAPTMRAFSKRVIFGGPTSTFS